MSRMSLGIAAFALAFSLLTVTGPSSAADRRADGLQRTDMTEFSSQRWRARRAVAYRGGYWRRTGWRVRRAGYWGGGYGVRRAAYWGGGYGVRRAAYWGGGYPGWGVRRAAYWGGYPGWRVRRAAYWGGYPGWRVRRAAYWGGYYPAYAYRPIIVPRPVIAVGFAPAWGWGWGRRWWW